MFGDVIKKLRTAHNLNQVQLAGKLNISKQTVSNWENNNILPSIEMLVKIADILNVSTDYLLCRDEFIQSCAVASGELKTNLPTYPKE